MKSGLVGAQLNDIEQILRKLELLETREHYPKYSPHPAQDFKLLSYNSTWEVCYSHRYYDFLLKDFSLLQFREVGHRSAELSYSFLECPFHIIPYADFVEFNLGLNATDVGDLFREEYEIELTSFPPKSGTTPIRYDYDPGSYVEGSHPASHVHFGHQSDIRVGTSNILMPLSFALFIIRQCYRTEWQSLCQMKGAEIWCRAVRENLDPLEDAYHNPLDKWEMMLA